MFRSHEELVSFVQNHSTSFSLGKNIKTAIDDVSGRFTDCNEYTRWGGRRCVGGFNGNSVPSAQLCCEHKTALTNTLVHCSENKYNHRFFLFHCVNSHLLRGPLGIEGSFPLHSEKQG